MTLFLITVIITTLLQFLPEERGLFAHGLPQVSSTDPCEASPCGKGAECKAMGSIAICVCPNDGKGDPFVNCMQQGSAEETMNVKEDTTAGNHFVASFDVNSVHHPNAKPTPISTAKPTVSTTTTPASTHRSTTQSPTKIITGSGSGSGTRSTTTKNPFVHVFETSTFRPPTQGSSVSSSGQDQGHGDSYDLYSHSKDRTPTPDRNYPESHRIPIVQNNNGNRNNYGDHVYPPRPINGNGLSSSTPSFNSYHGSGSGTGSSYDIFNEKTVADYGGGVTATSSYPYRGSSHGHFSGGTHHAYEYDSRPILPSPTPTYQQIDRFGHHGYHPSSSGFPGPITESSNYNPRYSTSSSQMSSSSYDIYNFNSVNGPYNYDRVQDPMGKYDNCRSVGGIVLCADNSNSNRYPPQYRDHDEYHRPMHPETTPAYNFPLRGEVTFNYHYNQGGYHHNRDRDHYSTYYPNQYVSSSRPIHDYNRFQIDHRQGYPQHGPREPIDSSYSNSRHPYVPKPQHISSQSVLTISSSPSTSSSSLSTTVKNDNDNPLCKSMCGINSICRLHLDRPVCGCPESHTGDPSVRCIPVEEGPAARPTSGGRGARIDGECERHADCKASEICAKSKCIDPCKDPEGFSRSSVAVGGSVFNRERGSSSSICGMNASCVVIMRTPVCKCEENFTGNPYVACVK